MAGRLLHLAAGFPNNNPEHSAERRTGRVINPDRRRMPLIENERLKQRIRELAAENETLQSRLDEILDIVAPPKEGDAAGRLGDQQSRRPRQ